MRFFRLIYIIFITFRYGLDHIILPLTPFKPLQSVFNVLFFWRNQQQSRAVRFRQALEALGPIFVKFGQMLSTRKDLLAPDIAEELTKLQDQVPPFSFAQVRAIIEKAYDQPLESVFADFNSTAIASASVAQVHFATLYNGQKVAVKVLRPDIENTIAKDIKLLETGAWLFQHISREGKRLKPREIVDEFASHTTSELDLTLEAANCSQLARNFPDERILIPKVHWDWCRTHVMVMQRMHGTPLMQLDTLRAKGIDITKLAHEVVEIFFTQVFRDGFFHADMHPGNIQVADDGRFITLDFGIMGSLNANDQYYLARNFLAFFNQDYRDVAVAHIESGWVPKDTNVDALENAVRAICEPIFNKPLKEISFGRTLLSLFQMSRRFGVNIQPQLIMLQKTLLNIEGLGRQLDPDIDLWHTAKPLLRRWMSEQFGWRSMIKTLRKEMPYLVKHTPEMPVLIHQFLAQQASAEQETPIRETIDALVQVQQKQSLWFKRITLIVLFIGLVNVVALVLLYLEMI